MNSKNNILDFVGKKTNLPNNGGNQLTLASLWESKKMMTSPFALLAPAIRALIRPDLSAKWMTRTFGMCFVT
jgi:hypothetical protein